MRLRAEEKVSRVRYFGICVNILHVNADYILEEDDVASSQMRIETMTRDFSIEEMNYLVKMIEGIREMRKAYEQNDKIG